MLLGYPFYVWDPPEDLVAALSRIGQFAVNYK